MDVVAQLCRHGYHLQDLLDSSPFRICFLYKLDSQIQLQEDAAADCRFASCIKAAVASVLDSKCNSQYQSWYAQRQKTANGEDQLDPETAAKKTRNKVAAQLARMGAKVK